ncbi:hypothetical protein ACFLUY_03245 [Chloroflexota bacterium]
MDVSSNDGIVKIGQVAPSSYPYTFNIDSGATVAVEAVPDSGYVFDGWSGSLSGTTNPAFLVIDCNKKIAASFSRAMYTLTMDINSGGGTLEVNRVAPFSYPFTYDFSGGATVTIEAVPDFGHVFDSWSGDLSDAANPAFLVIDNNKNITAIFSTDWTAVIVIIVSLVIVGLLVTAVIIRRRAG